MLAPLRDVSLVMEIPQRVSGSGAAVLSGLVLADEDLAPCRFVKGSVKGLLISSSQEGSPGLICCGGSESLQICMSREHGFGEGCWGKQYNKVH